MTIDRHGCQPIKQSWTICGDCRPLVRLDHITDYRYIWIKNWIRKYSMRDTEYVQGDLVRYLARLWPRFACRSEWSTFCTITAPEKKWFKYMKRISELRQFEMKWSKRGHKLLIYFLSSVSLVSRLRNILNFFILSAQLFLSTHTFCWLSSLSSRLNYSYILGVCAMNW